MSDTRYKLHWVSIIVDIIEILKVSALPLIPILLLGRRDTDETSHWLVANWNILLLGAFLLFMLISSIIKWRRFEYWFENDELRMETGIFIKKKRYIPFERIQSLDYTESVFHRPFNLVMIKMETAGGAAPVKAELTAITKQAAKLVEYEMIEAKKRKLVLSNTSEQVLETDDEQNASQRKSVFNMKTKDLLLLATTSGGIGIILSGMLVALNQLKDVIPFERWFDVVSNYVTLGFALILFIIFISLFIVWLLSVAMTYFSYFDFSVMLDEEDIVITRGLLDKKSSTIPLNRVQAVRIIENPFRQLFGYATVVIDNAGGDIGQKATITLFPLIKKSIIATSLTDIFPGLLVDEPTGKLPKWSRRYYYQLQFIWMVPLIGVTTYYIYPYGLLSLLIAPLIICYGHWCHRSGAFSVAENQIVLTFRRFNLHTAYLLKHRIQSLQMKQNIFQRRKGVATISARIKSGMGAYNAELKFMSQDDAEQLLAWYRPRR